MVLSFRAPRLVGQDVRDAGQYWRMGGSHVIGSVLSLFNS